MHCLKHLSLTVAALMFLALVAVGPAYATTPEVGTTKGTFEVNPDGAAIYTIPIAVPPGKAGMEPKLGLTYNSQRGNGLLGVGWTISGLSAIQRCPATIDREQDGFAGGVSFDSSDRYCLDGQRLVLMPLVDRHGRVIVYGTERETWSKIVGYGPRGGQHESFKVWSKDGRIMEYGFTSDSRIEANGPKGPAVRVWALNRVEDTVGNVMTITYEEDDVDGEYRPLLIDYGGRSVSFEYEEGERPDSISGYVGGSMVSVTRRLKAIHTSVNSDAEPVRSYNLAYYLGGAANRSRLKSVTECGFDSACFPETVFTYTEGGTDAFSAADARVTEYGQRVGKWRTQKHLRMMADVDG
ncbi:MAG: SpvB/TcaC N-terminal domain-containing protein, partial [Planctomycetota bacterium]